MARIKTWVAVLIAVAIVAFALMLAVVGGSVYWVTRHIETQATSIDRAEDELSRTRARFAGQLPLVEIRGRDDVVVRRDARAGARRTELTTLHVIAFDPDEGRIMHVNIPFGLLRLAPGGRMRFGASSVDANVRLTLDDVEASGPGLLIDGRAPEGQPFIVWTE
jgi:hypothetical protein